MITDGSDIDDPAICPAYEGKKGLDYCYLSEEIDLEDIPQLIRGGMFYRSGNADTSIVQQSIEPAFFQSFLYLLGCCSNRDRISNVEVNGLHIPLRLGPKGLRIALPANRGEHTPSVPRQSQGGGSANPAGRPSNQY